MDSNGLTVYPDYVYTPYSSPVDTDANAGTIDIDIDASKLVDANKLKLDWDTFKGINIKIGDEIITISKEEFAEVLFKLFPNLTPKFAAAMLDKILKEAKC